MSDWTLFSNHGHVLVCLARDPQARLRDVATSVGITERAVQKIVRDLQQGDMISVSKQGRRNQYRIHRKASLRHSLESENSIGGLIDFIIGSGKSVPVTKRAVTVKATALKPVDKADVSKSPQPQPAKVSTPEELETEKPATEDSVTKKPAAEKPTTEDSVTGKPVTEKKAAQKKVTTNKDLEKAKAKSDLEKQQGSLF